MQFCHIAYVWKLLVNVRSDVSRWTRGLKIVLGPLLLSYYVCVRSESSSEAICMRSLVGAFTARQINKNQHHMCWQIHRKQHKCAKTFQCGSLIYFLVQKRMWIVYTSSLQCYSVLSDILVKNELCIPLERGSNVLSTGEGFICLSPPSKLKIAVLFCSSYKKTISFSAIGF